MSATPIEQLKREALAGLTPHTKADYEAVLADRRKVWLAAVAVTQVAAAPVLAGKDRK